MKKDEAEWRPFEPNAENLMKAKREVHLENLAKKYVRRKCNRHSDCDAADEMIRAAGGRTVNGITMMYAKHE